MKKVLRFCCVGVLVLSLIIIGDACLLAMMYGLSDITPIGVKLFWGSLPALVLSLVVIWKLE